jgi:hypothetical protein
MVLIPTTSIARQPFHFVQKVIDDAHFMNTSPCGGNTNTRDSGYKKIEQNSN